ncbi:fatty acid--CoA ligase family protein [Novosphingobium sp. MMS21-SN21R]|uniref:class I adenylate-forming enzyme family protein n=1 Tax=Novosphingobium sp. MMS21-SN21R TaxID=2969298 RepID=UPI002888AB44|nr:fatty acid--CoA ligase family protein [Novosphingobium sp. MMS21-SN21R]MDT0509773.1 fatty acid--CoA ligase family protein [Novosphingobium sp. MMS21-SN21R]
MNKLSQLAAQVLERRSDEPALEFEGRWYSWNEVVALADKLTTLIDASGGPQNGPVVFIARSRGSAIGAFLALIRTGRTIRMVYPFQSPAGIVRDIEMMEPSIVVATERELKEEVLEGIRARGAAAISITEMDATHIAGFERSTAALPAALPAEPQIEILTSGTTGKPKPFAVKHEMLGTYFTGGTMALFGKDANAVELPPALLYYPLGNISGLFGILPSVLNGLKLIVIDRFSVKDWHQYIVKYRPTSNGTPAAAVQMILDAGIPKEDLASIQYFSTGAAPLDPRVQSAFEERYGIPVLLSYGATEFGGPVCAMSPDLYAEFGKSKFGSVGRPFGGAQIRIVDQETGEILGPGQEGLLQVVSPKMGPEWIHTSDVGVLDEDGFLFLRGRADGAIMRGGFKILPETIQEALLGHPAISAVSAVGIAERRLGQVPAVAMELKPGAQQPSIEELEAFLRERVLATYIPVHWKFVDELPKTVSLKVDRPAVIALFADQAQASA